MLTRATTTRKRQQPMTSSETDDEYVMRGRHTILSTNDTRNDRPMRILARRLHEPTQQNLNEKPKITADTGTHIQRNRRHVQRARTSVRKPPAPDE